jgi:hypothetical protein
MKLVICFILALAPLAAGVGTPLYGTHGHPAPRTEKGGRKRKAENVRTGHMNCGACSRQLSPKQSKHEQTRTVR